MILTDKIKHQYDVWQGDEKSKRTALSGVSLDVRPGEFIAILGANGSGKSTLAKHLNVLLLPDEGVVKVKGMDTADEQHLWEIRTAVGMVFQNPDNQIIGTSVEEDVAFGPENRNMESSLIQQKVADSLDAVGLLSKRIISPYRLSGGQKQRVAVAGVLAVDSECIVFDEPTAMLDPLSRRELMAVIEKLHKEGRTIILITHHSDEAAGADRIILMDKGSIAGCGTPEEIFSNPGLLERTGMDVPPVCRLACRLQELGIISKAPILGREELIGEIVAEYEKRGRRAEPGCAEQREDAKADAAGAPILELRDVEYTYDRGTANEAEVLKGVSFGISEGECVALIGGSGEGKTTLIKHLNGLLKAERGDVLYRGESIYRKGYKLSDLRKEVGLVFQSAESQLFCKTVLDDVAFGPRRMGMSDAEAMDAAKRSLEAVGIGEEYYASDPMDLSGGQKRRVAIAGILSMEPAVLVLDEPAAGLDPGTKKEIFGVIDGIRRERAAAVVLVSHEMEDVAEYADRVMLLSGGRIEADDTPKAVFSQVERIREMGADVPAATDIMYELRMRGLPLTGLEVKIDEAADSIAGLFGKEAGIS